MFGSKLRGERHDDVYGRAEQSDSEKVRAIAASNGCT
jgi:hypothetical protein